LDEVPEIGKEKAVLLMKENVDAWDKILEEQMDHLAGYAMLVFRVPRNVLLPSNARVHESIENYSVKEDAELDEKVEQALSRIKNVCLLCTPWW